MNGDKSQFRNLAEAGLTLGLAVAITFAITRHLSKQQEQTVGTRAPASGAVALESENEPTERLAPRDPGPGRGVATPSNGADRAQIRARRKECFEKYGETFPPQNGMISDGVKECLKAAGLPGHPR